MGKMRRLWMLQHMVGHNYHSALNSPTDTSFCASVHVANQSSAPAPHKQKLLFPFHRRLWRSRIYFYPRRTNDCMPITLHEATIIAGRPSVTRSYCVKSPCPRLVESLMDEMTAAFHAQAALTFGSSTVCQHSTHLTVPDDSHNKRRYLPTMH